MRILAFLLSGVLLSSAIVHAEPTATSPPAKSTDDIHVMIRNLGSDQFAVRQRAAQRLKQLKLKALPHLQSATTSKDAEVRMRATKLINEILREAPFAEHFIWAMKQNQPIGKLVHVSSQQSNVRSRQRVLVRKGEIELRFYGYFPHGSKTSAEYVFGTEGKAHETFLVLENEELVWADRICESVWSRFGTDGVLPIAHIKFVWVEDGEPRVTDLRDMLGKHADSFFNELQWTADNGLGASTNLKQRPEHEPKARVNAEIHLVLKLAQIKKKQEK